ncbi:MAG: selenide, water dikinase SelD [Rhodospirillales bacterium]|nr:selenide, water dikinase SelD [Rhodospirillales bacterium]
MTPTSQTLLDVVLIGGGHAHVEVLRSAAMAPVPGVRLTVVARDTVTPYSGMLPGYLAGIYSHAEAHIDLRPLCARAGARLIHAPATGLDPEARIVTFAGRPPLRFDVAMIDIGSTPVVADIEGAERALPVKPVDLFLDRWMAVEDAVLASDGPWHLTVVGGGAGGAEVCLGLANRVRERLSAEGDDPTRVRAALVTDGDTLLPRHNPGARRRMADAMTRDSVAVHLERHVARVAEDHVLCVDGTEIPVDTTVLVTGAAAPGWLRDTGLALDDGGFIAVDRFLRSHSHVNVFAAGDVAGFTEQPLVKNGVYAVRQGPLLARQLRNIAAGRPLEPFIPQHRTMALISTGRQHAIGSWGSLAFDGDWAWRWKDRIDRVWMEKYQQLPAIPEMDDTPMRCGGCGAKVPARILQRALERLDLPSRSEVITGLEAPDDAAVIAPPPGQVAVQTVDQFPAFVDDPWVFGRIAAVHALSDVHAMGAAPVAALALVGLLPGTPDAMEDDLVQMIEGVLSILRVEDCALVGGHTTGSERASLGLTVTGFADPDRLVRKSGLKAGDALILTRPLGTGTLFAADMRGKAESAWIEAAVAAMQRSNGPAADVFLEHGIHAMTDITGFGLAGHLHEMLAASGVAAAITLGVLPVYPGARALLSRGIASTLHPGNVAALEGLLDPGTIDPIVFDPQTAGGLLAGIPANRAEACITALHEAGDTDAVVIGHIVDDADSMITIRD